MTDYISVVSGGNEFKVDHFKLEILFKSMKVEKLNLSA